MIRGVQGFVAHSRLHTAKVVRISEDLPVLVEIVDREDRIRAFIAECDAMAWSRSRWWTSSSTPRMRLRSVRDRRPVRLSPVGRAMIAA